MLSMVSVLLAIHFIQLAKKAVDELKFPFIRGVQCRVLPYTFKFAKVQSKND